MAIQGPFGILGALEWYGSFEHPSLHEPVSPAINWVISMLGSHLKPHTFGHIVMFFAGYHPVGTTVLKSAMRDLS